MYKSTSITTCDLGDVERIIMNRTTATSSTLQPSTSVEHSDYENMYPDMEVSSHRVTDIQDSLGTVPTDSVTVTNSIALSNQGVNLCGAVGIKEVRQLMKEWMESTPCPQSEDELVLMNYLNELKLDKDLEQVDLVLKYMVR